MYSIGEVTSATGITISALRYYDREGMFPDMERTSGGIRVFSDVEIGIIKMIECLKASGMPIKDIKQFLDWCQDGDSTLKKRRDMFYERREAVIKHMENLQKTLDIIQFKCWYYDTALEAGSEDTLKNTSDEHLPDDIKICKQKHFEIKQ